MSGCTVKTMKYITFFINFLIFIGSLALVIACGLQKAHVDPALAEAMKIPSGSVTFLLVFASFGLVISFFGCCGAINESPCMLGTFATLVAICLLVQIVCAGIIISYKNTFIDGLNDELFKDLNSVKNNTDAGIGDNSTNPLIVLQEHLHCCGVNASSNWDHVSKEFLDGQYPPTCCDFTGTTVQTCNAESKNIYNKTCSHEFVEAVKGGVVVIGAFGIILALVQVLAIVFACVMAKSFKRDYDVV